MKDEAVMLPVLYLRHIKEQLQCMGTNVAAWLARSGLTDTQLSDPGLTLSLPRFTRLVDDALDITAEPALGLFVGERLVPGTHGILGYAVTSSGTLGQALDVLVRYSSVRISLLSIAQVVERGQVRVVIAEAEPLGTIARPVLEAAVLSVKNVLDAASMGACAPRVAAFAFARPAYAPLARTLLGCEVRYGASWTGLAYSADVLDLPLRLADPDAFREAERVCQRELDERDAEATLSSRVRRHLFDRQHGFPTLSVTARLFRMTPRTLHRRLVDEGTSFRLLLDDVRHRLAVEHVRADRLALAEIACELGYADLASFRRAWKRWEKVPPSVFRTTRG